MFEVKDWRGRIVRMTRRTYENHKDRHPEVPEYVEEAKQAIADPDIVAEADNGAIQLFRYGVGRKPYTKLYLEVVVYYRGHPPQGTVATYHFSDRLGAGVRVLEHRHQWVAGQRFSLGAQGEQGGSRD